MLHIHLYVSTILVGGRLTVFLSSRVPSSAGMGKYSFLGKGIVFVFSQKDVEFVKCHLSMRLKIKKEWKERGLLEKLPILFYPKKRPIEKVSTRMIRFPLVHVSWALCTCRDPRIVDRPTTTPHSPHRELLGLGYNIRESESLLQPQGVCSWNSVTVTAYNIVGTFHH
jgi:hypothetical protein